jgi:hypothetical protein
LRLSLVDLHPGFQRSQINVWPVAMYLFTEKFIRPITYHQSSKLSIAFEFLEQHGKCAETVVRLRWDSIFFSSFKIPFLKKSITANTFKNQT